MNIFLCLQKFSRKTYNFDIFKIKENFSESQQTNTSTKTNEKIDTVNTAAKVNILVRCKAHTYFRAL